MMKEESRSRNRSNYIYDTRSLGISLDKAIIVTAKASATKTCFVAFASLPRPLVEGKRQCHCQQPGERDKEMREDCQQLISKR